MMMKKLYRRLSLLAAMLLMFTSAVLAQERTVSGTVTDESGQGMPGVNVLLKGTATGAATDVDGNFKISIPSDEAVLTFSFVGYATSEIIVGSRSVVNVQMTPDVRTLTELVVTGYTTQRKADITGAVSVVDADQLKTVKAANIGQMLAGRAAGVTVSNSGEPGSGTNIRVRGPSSFGGGDPLYIIDGVQVQGDKNLNGLNPNDIESMQVLKDAGAASIYGARASAGVIVITTKKGKPGAPKVTYDGFIGTQAPVKGYNDFLVKDPEVFADYHVQKDPSLVGFYGGNAANPVVPDIFYAPPGWGGDPSDYFMPTALSGGYQIMESNKAGTDWWDETFRNDALLMDHNIGLSGGSDKALYSASVGYYKQDGTLIHTGFERLSARMNSQFTAGRFTIGENLAFTRVNMVTTAGGSQNEQNNITQILKLNSIVPVYDIGGYPASAKQTGFSNGSNPTAMAIRNKDNEQNNHRLLGSVFAELKITEWLKARSTFAFDYSQNFAPNFNYPRWENREVNSTITYSENWQTFMNWTWTNMLEFNKKFDKHNFSAFVGYESNQAQNRRINASMVGYFSLNEAHRYLNEALGDYNTLISSQQIQTMVSTFAKVDYDFNERFLVSATIRRDGSSNFVTEKYGVFPAFTLGYRISEESFMSGVAYTTNLKAKTKKAAKK
jgi:TonB-linked SusC/RagA family outer membrane protein